jgi:hypothetical protein
MRIKFIVILLVLASLACTANVSVLRPTGMPSLAASPSTITQTPPPVSALPLEGLPNVIPADISAIHMLDPQNGWRPELA